MTALLTVLLAAGPISVDFRGTLGEALSEIASKGDVNLIATGELNVPAEVHLKGVTAEEAIDALVKVHGLELHKEGKLWVVKPMSGSPRAAAGLDVPVPPVPLARPVPPVPPVPPVMPAMPVPPLPPLPPNATAEELEAHAEAARDRAEEAKDRAEAARDRAEAARDAKDAEAEEKEARLEEVKAAVEEAKAHAHDVKSSHKTVSTGPVVIPDGQHVDDVVSYGGSVTLGDGVHADGDVVAFGGDVVLGDGVRVDGDAVSFGGTVKKGDGTKVKGEEVSFGGKGLGATAKALPSIKVDGDEVSPAKKASGGFAAFLINFATFFGLGFLLMMFAPNRMRNIEAEIRQEPVKSGLAGLLALLGSIPLTILLVLTVVGIPIMVVMWMLAGLAMVMGMLALANTLGARFPIARLKRTQALMLAVGLLAIMLVGVVPVLGPLVIAAALCVSFGAMIRTRVGQRSRAGLPMPESGPIREVVG